jgi:hypothetical protein
VGPDIVLAKGLSAKRRSIKSCETSKSKKKNIPEKYFFFFKIEQRLEAKL